MFTDEVVLEITAASRKLGLEPAALLAIAEVESGGRAYAMVEGRQEPLIRFEGHYFDRRLSPVDRARARAADLASPDAGGVLNPATQAGRWALLERAAAIDRKAAYESVSWGLGQVMGAHWDWLGYDSVDALVTEARDGIAGQVRLTARFIGKSGLGKALRSRDWSTFARGYNGPAYARHGYDRKIAAAYRRYASENPASTDDVPPTLRRGASGEFVRELQRLLAALGYHLIADGDFGPVTATAVRKFQQDHGLYADGVVGRQTWTAARQLAEPERA